MTILACVCNSVSWWDKIDVLFNILGVFATVAAVVVALRANRKATEQLQKTIEMQEQSKNVELFDKREALIKSIQSGKNASIISLELLFNEEIVLMYKKWHKLMIEENLALNDWEYASNLHKDNREELEAKYKEVHANSENEKESLVQLMEKYISNSIRPLKG